MYSFGYFPGVWLLYADVSEHYLFHLHRLDMKYTSYPAYEVYFISSLWSILHIQPMKYTSYPAYEVYFISSLWSILHIRPMKYTSYPAYEDGTDSVPKRRHTTIRHRGNTQKNTYKIHKLQHPMSTASQSTFFTTVANLPQIQFRAGLMLHVVRFSQQHYQGFWSDGMWQLCTPPPPQCAGNLIHPNGCHAYSPLPDPTHILQKPHHQPVDNSWCHKASNPMFPISPHLYPVPALLLPLTSVIMLPIKCCVTLALRNSWWCWLHWCTQSGNGDCSPCFVSPLFISSPSPLFCSQPKRSPVGIWFVISHLQHINYSPSHDVSCIFILAWQLLHPANRGRPCLHVHNTEPS
jgi:hypothetical protein